VADIALLLFFFCFFLGDLKSLVAALKRNAHANLEFAQTIDLGDDFDCFGHDQPYRIALITIFCAAPHFFEVSGGSDAGISAEAFIECD
jgi:hypothetical protein